MGPSLASSPQSTPHRGREFPAGPWLQLRTSRPPNCCHQHPHVAQAAQSQGSWEPWRPACCYLLHSSSHRAACSLWGVVCICPRSPAVHLLRPGHLRPAGHTIPSQSPLDSLLLTCLHLLLLPEPCSAPWTIFTTSSCNSYGICRWLSLSEPEQRSFVHMREASRKLCVNETQFRKRNRLDG